MEADSQTYVGNEGPSQSFDSGRWGRVTGIALIIPVLFSIYGDMPAANGLIGALNVINEEHETHGVIRLTFRAAWLTAAAIFVALAELVRAGVFVWLQATGGRAAVLADVAEG